MSSFVIGIIGVIGFLVLLMLRMPIAYAMALAGFLGLASLSSPDAALRLVATDLYGSFATYSLTVLPMYLLMGYLAFYSGIGTRLFSFAYRMVGHLPGGLAMATQIAAALFGAVCGSTTATAATIGAVSLPEMKKYKYDDSIATASVASGGILGALIPPSITFIIYGIATQQSIGKLFLAGIGPGILLMLLYIGAIFILTARNPALAPPGKKSSWKERFQALQGSLGEVMLIFIFTMGGLLLGWFTPTEAGAIGAAGVLLVAIIGKNINWEKFKLSLHDTAATVAMIMFLLAGAIIFSRFMALSRIPFEIGNWVGNLPYPPFVVMGIIILIYLVLGCFIDALGLVLLTVPIFYPVVVDVLGYDPIWFGVIIVMVAGMGVITPPVGMNVFIIKSVAKDVPLEVIFKGIWPFLYAIILSIVLLIVFPQIALFLPNNF